MGFIDVAFFKVMKIFAIFSFVEFKICRSCFYGFICCYRFLTLIYAPQLHSNIS